MNTNIIKKFKWFWVWQDEREEIWLAEMAQQGYHLEKVSLPGYYYFQVGEPGSFIYRMDYQSLKTPERENYLQLFADAGWEHVGDMTSWVYFRKQVQPGAEPEIYSDVESKISKYQRIIAYLVIFLPIMFVIKPNGRDHMTLGLVVEGLFLILMFIYIFAMIQLFRRVSQLKESR